MAIGCADALSKMGSGAVTSRLQAGYADTDLDRAWVHWNAAQYPEAIEDLLKAGDHLRLSCSYADYAYSPYHDEGANVYYLKNCIDIPDVNMDAIIYAMLTAEPDEVMYFVGLVDAFRQSIWNRPYNQEFFAAIARGFML